MARRPSEAITRRRRIRAIETKRDSLVERIARDRIELKKIRAQLKEERKR